MLSSASQYLHRCIHSLTRRRASGVVPLDASAVPGCRTALLDLRPGDRARLPTVGEEPGEVRWSEPVTITGVLLVDTGLVQVRWLPEEGQDEFSAHLLLTGRAFRAGAIRTEPTSHA